MTPRIVLCAALAAFATASAHAHHSFSALFDASKIIGATGEIVAFEFKAPHSYLHLRVTDDAGGDVEWQVETTTPGMLIRQGITPEVLKPGLIVSVEGNPTRDGRPLIRLLTITMPDGREIRVQ